MYPASAAFHQAATSGAPTRILLRFGDTLFTNEDIQQPAHVRYDEAMNAAGELTIGTTQDSKIATIINNDHRLLDSFEFGECTAQLAARTETGSVDSSIANCMTIMRFGMNQELRFEGWSSLPYLTINGYAPTAQPPWPVYAILTSGNMVYCVAEDGEAWIATWVDGRTWASLTGQTWDEISTSRWDDVQGILIPATALDKWQDLASKTWDEMKVFTWNSFIDLPDLNAFMRRKASLWARDRRGMSWNSDVLYEFKTDGSYEKYEYVKLGVFDVKTPAKRKQITIAISGVDRMRRFETGATDFWNALTWPTTLGDIFKKLCTFVGVPQATLSFINSSRTFAEPPTQMEEVSAREILAWIAGAAGSIARMTRDGGVELAWFGQQDVVLDESRWFNVEIAEYSVAQIDKLQVKAAEHDIGVVVGSGTNGYVLLDNPFLYGDSDTSIRTAAVPIYQRLIAFPAFAPIKTRVISDWSIQAGDIISFVDGSTTYTLPIYSQTITWDGVAVRADIANTGEPSRPEVNAQNRRVFAQKRAMHILEVSVDGFKSQISDIEGNVANIEAYAKSITLSVTNESTSSTIELKAGSTVLAGREIKMSGLVSFTNLSTAGQTTINGGNISTGTIDANKATITNINASNISAGTLDSARINVDTLQVKHLNGADGTFTGTLSGANGTFGGNLSAAGGTFTGTLSAASGSFSGRVTATEGAIAGFTINSNGLSSNSLTVNSSSGRIDFGSTASLYAVSGAAQASRTESSRQRLDSMSPSSMR